MTSTPLASLHRTTSEPPVRGVADAVLDDLLHQLGAQRDDAGGSVRLLGADPVVASPHHLADAMSAAMAAYAVQAAAVGRARGGPRRDVTVTAADAVAQLMAVFHTRVGDVPVSETMEDPNLLGDSDFYRTGDGGWIYLLMSYPHLRDRVCAVLDCPPRRDRLERAVATWDAIALEEAVVAAGGTATAVRTREQWRTHEVGKHLLDQKIVTIERIGEAPARPFATVPDELGPLDGVRVLDLSHVIAGPVGGRLLAELGADVLHVSRADLPDPNAMIIETGRGKRNAYLDLRDPAQSAQWWSLVDDADVVMSNYRDLDAKGVSPVALSQRRPGVIVADFHGWGPDGPWSTRGGFDQLACAATGFALEEGGDHPALPPTYLLNDYLAAFLGAAGVLTALRRRAEVGGSWRVHVDLAKVCMWVQDLGRVEHANGPATEGAARPTGDRMRHTPGPFGDVSYLPTALDVQPPWPTPDAVSRPLGSAPPAWEHHEPLRVNDTENRLGVQR